jgi:hypothetical protein
VEVPGFRVRELVVVTTLTDAERYPRKEIARLFRLRWHVELDLRNIKTVCGWMIFEGRRRRRSAARSGSIGWPTI